MHAAATGTDRGRLAGFWIRLLADTLDAVVLFAVGALLSLPFGGLFRRLGERGVFIGLAVSMVYSGVLQSRFGDGRTVGKRLLGLKVVRLDGSLMSLDRALVRYAMMGLLVYQAAAAYAIAALVPFASVEWLETVLGAIALVLALGCVVVVPFHPLKRGLHDLLAGTIVIRGAMPDPVFVAGQTNARRDRRILIAAGGLAAVTIAASAIVAGRSSSPSSWAVTGARISQRLRQAGALNVGVANNKTWMVGQSPVTTVVATGFIPRPANGEPDWTAAETAFVQAVRAELPPDQPVDRVATVVRSGYNIGIFKSYEVQTRVFDARTSAALEASDQRSW